MLTVVWNGGMAGAGGWRRARQRKAGRRVARATRPNTHATCILLYSGISVAARTRAGDEPSHLADVRHALCVGADPRLAEALRHRRPAPRPRRCRRTRRRSCSTRTRRSRAPASPAAIVSGIWLPSSSCGLALRVGRQLAERVAIGVAKGRGRLRRARRFAREVVQPHAQIVGRKRAVARSSHFVEPFRRRPGPPASASRKRSRRLAAAAVPDRMQRAHAVRRRGCSDPSPSRPCRPARRSTRSRTSSPPACACRRAA